MNLVQAIDRLGDHVSEPTAPRVEFVEQFVYSLNRSTLDESARIIRENPELAKQMGVVP